MKIFYTLLLSALYILRTDGLQYILATDNTCYDARQYTQGFTFTAPANGDLVGIKLEHVSGGVSCSSATVTNWGCDADLLMIEMIKEGAGATTYYPTTGSVDTLQLNSACTDTSHGCSVHYSRMNGVTSNDQFIEFIDETSPYFGVTTNDVFSIQFGEGCCSHSHTDNQGTACSKVWFIYKDASPDIDCQVSSWIDDGVCSVICGGGSLHQTREIVIAKQGDGADCPVLGQDINCNTDPCPIHCQVSDWIPDDGGCSTFCGADGLQTETRSVVVEPEHGGDQCPDLTQDVPCNTDIDCCPSIDSQTFDWDDLTERAEGKPLIDIFKFDIDPNDLSLNIIAKLPYLGRATADDQEVANFGVTYVLDFEDFDAHENKINEPGTCQNRMSSSFIGKTFDKFWDYSDEPQNGNVGRSDNQFLAYPEPPNDKWLISMDNNECNTVVYEGHFTWQELRDCTASGGGDSYTSVFADDGEGWLNLTGVFYINLVSPFWFGSEEDTGYYRVYQLMSQPFVIAVSSTVYVVGSTGINLMTMSIIAVYKEDDERRFKLVVMTETAQYMTLIRGDTNVEFEKGADNNNNFDNRNFEISIKPENENCLENKHFLCSQLWEIKTENVVCEKGVKGTDFSGTYRLIFQAHCKDNIETTDYCLNWLDAHEDIKNGPISLSAPLVWKDEICDPKVFTVQLLSDMTFYAHKDKNVAFEYNDDNKVGTVASSEPYLYAVGEDTIYVSIDTHFPEGTFEIFETELMNVWICTFPIGSEPPTELGDEVNHGITEAALTMGCFNDNRDEYDDYFYHIFEKGEQLQPDHEFNEDETETISNIERFSFKVPDKVARDTLFVHVQIEVTFKQSSGGGERRRILYRRHRSAANTANKIQHFVDNIGINHGQKYEPKQPEKEPKEPYNNYNPYNPPKQPLSNPLSPTTRIPSLWIIIIGCLLTLILTLNIAFMIYINYCNKRGRGTFQHYEMVKNNHDSEYFDESEANPINL